MSRKGQSWSVDLVVAVVIFGFIAIVITSFALLDRPDVKELEVDAQRVSVALEQERLSFGAESCGALIAGEVLDTEQMDCLFARDPAADYGVLRREIGVEGDFCIFLEDEDGRVVSVKDRAGWGSGELTINGVDCGQKLSVRE